MRDIVIAQVKKEIPKISGEDLNKLLERAYVTKDELMNELEEYAKKTRTIFLYRDQISPATGSPVKLLK